MQNNNESANEPANEPDAPETAQPGRLQRIQEWWYREFRRIMGAWVFVVVLLSLGAISVAAIDFTDYIFSHNTFCGNVCHVMESTVYEELQESTHWKTTTGVRATCADCHVDGRLSMAMIDHFLGTGELFVNITNDFSKPGSFEEFRPAAANRERFKLIKNDSKGCRGCHVMEAIKPERVRGQNQHREAMEKGITCILCHYNLVHKAVEPSEEFMNTIDAVLSGGEDESSEGDAGGPEFPDEEGLEVL
jgi:nitrate/TMAO reductase-like tetraheme cytochrome c subunit